MTTVLIDGNHLLCRVAFIPELRQLTTRGGLHTGPVYGFLRVLRSTLENFKAHSCIVVWDSGRSAYRKKLYPEYKANRDDGERPEALENIEEQSALLQELLPYFNVKQLVIKECEGDDLLWLLCTEIDGEKIAVTGDKDLLQLVTLGAVVYRPIADELVEDSNFDEITGVPAYLFPLKKALVGDKSDNIDGIRGVGEKTAIKLLREVFCKDDVWVEEPDDFLTAFSEAVSAHKTKTAQRINEDWEIVERNLRLMDLSEYPFTDKDRAKARAVANAPSKTGFTDVELMKMLGKYEFNDFTTKFVRWISPFKRLV